METLKSLTLPGFHVHLRTFAPSYTCPWPERVAARLCVFLAGNMREKSMSYEASDVVYRPPEDRPRLRFGNRGARINTARALASLDDPLMEGFVSQLEEVNALADESPGFVWRLADESGNAATDIHAFDDERILVNMSVWESLDALREFSYRGRHASLLRDRGKWFEPGSTQITMWWVTAGSIPSVEDAKQKLELLEANGPTAAAFTFKDRFPPPG